MAGLLLGYTVINLVLGTVLFMYRDNELTVVALIIAMAATGLLFLSKLNSISARIENNVESINKGQLNKNVKKTGIIMFDSIASAMNEFLHKIRSLIGN
ncbi:MAG TPA: hypothetical protein PK481_10000, partial [Bacillota bacterium]|nr:hypothetical protein [Bacillota bacterium]